LRRNSRRLSDSGHGSSATCSDRCAGVQLIAYGDISRSARSTRKHGRERPAPRHTDDGVQPHQTIARRRGSLPGATTCRSLDGGGSNLREGDVIASDDGSSARATSRAGPLSAERSAPHLFRRERAARGAAAISCSSAYGGFAEVARVSRSETRMLPSAIVRRPFGCPVQHVYTDLGYSQLPVVAPAASAPVSGPPALR
jgi:hypothetical protein